MYIPGGSRHSYFNSGKVYILLLLNLKEQVVIKSLVLNGEKRGQEGNAAEKKMRFPRMLLSLTSNVLIWLSI